MQSVRNNSIEEAFFSRLVQLNSERTAWITQIGFKMSNELIILWHEKKVDELKACEVINVRSYYRNEAERLSLSGLTLRNLCCSLAFWHVFECEASLDTRSM